MDNPDRTTDSIDGRIERAKDSALAKHDSNPSHLDEAGEALGGIGGVLTGAAIGSAAGPIGTIIGGAAVAIGGWWAGRAVTEAASKLTADDDEYYRGEYDRSTNKLADRAYEDVRPAYYLGHIAAENPDYANRRFSDVQSDLQRGWSAEHAKKHGDWTTVAPFANAGFTRASAKYAAAGTMDRAATSAERAADKAATTAADEQTR